MQGGGHVEVPLNQTLHLGTLSISIWRWKKNILFGIWLNIYICSTAKYIEDSHLIYGDGWGCGCNNIWLNVTNAVWYKMVFIDPTVRTQNILRACYRYVIRDCSEMKPVKEISACFNHPLVCRNICPLLLKGFGYASKRGSKEREMIFMQHGSMFRLFILAIHIIIPVFHYTI